jgi:hypothetical protein
VGDLLEELRVALEDVEDLLEVGPSRESNGRSHVG